MHAVYQKCHINSVQKMEDLSIASDKIKGDGGVKTANARQAIESAILAGRFVAGEKLNEASLSTQFGVSRGTIREALRSLASAGAIEIIPNRGAFVRKLKLVDVLEYYDVRASLFAYAAQTVTNRLTAEMAAQLEESLVIMKGTIEREDAIAYHAENLRFHDMLFDMSNNRKATEIYHTLMREISIYRAKMIYNRAVMLNSYNEHIGIVRAIVDGDEDTAGRLARAHIMGGKTRFVNYFRDID
jgi:DNA-binding GntR family transcriptional regulator